MGLFWRGAYSIAFAWCRSDNRSLFSFARLERKIQTVVLGILSFSGIAAIIFNLVTWGSPYEYLPLHLCSLTAMVLPVVVIVAVYLGAVYLKQIVACFKKKAPVKG